MYTALRSGKRLGDDDVAELKYPNSAPEEACHIVRIERVPSAPKIQLRELHELCKAADLSMSVAYTPNDDQLWMLLQVLVIGYFCECLATIWSK
jgi:hypothetical protein